MILRTVLSHQILTQNNRTHPYFISIEAYKELIEGTTVMDNASIVTDDWNEQTIASWRHSVWVGVYDPRGFIFKPTKYIKCLRDAYCLERMHRAFDRGLMQYGMFAARKAAVDVVGESEERTGKTKAEEKPAKTTEPGKTVKTTATKTEPTITGLGQAYSVASRDQFLSNKSS
jgi:hypothetical protein